MRKTILCAVACVCAAMPAFLSGCGGGGGNRSLAQMSGPVSATGRYADLRFAVSAPKRTYAVGETIPLTFTVQNTGAADETVLHYFTVTDGAVSLPNGLQVARLNQGAVFPGIVLDKPYTLRFPAGQTQSFPMQWNQQTSVGQGGTQAPPGVYRIRAYVDVDNLSGRTVPLGTLGTDDLTVEIK